MEIRAIHDGAAYRRTMARIDRLMELNNGDGPEKVSDEADELEVLSILAERYEEERFPMDLPSPVAAVRFALEQRGLGQPDLARILGSRSRASELLNGNLKGLSRRMMKVLHDELHVPADILIRDC